MVFEPTERLHLGAEAEVWKGTWFGRPAVRKQRRPRSWRHPNLDHRLGVRRMISEARLLIRTRKAGLSVPCVWDLDYDGGQLILEHLDGRPLIELLNDDETTALHAESVLRKVGAAVRALHRVATTHGDLSSNNILIDGEDVHLIDFGLASVEYDVERFGIDLTSWMKFWVPLIRSGKVRSTGWWPDTWQPRRRSGPHRCCKEEQSRRLERFTPVWRTSEHGCGITADGSAAAHSVAATCSTPPPQRLRARQFGARCSNRAEVQVPKHGF